MRGEAHKDLGGSGIIVLCFFLSGATGLVYQVVWLRVLGLVFGHTVYATTTVLAAFMAGLALGSLLAARRMPKLQRLIAVYGWLEIGIGACCALLPIALENAPPLWVALSNGLGLHYRGLLLVEFVLAFALLVVPTTLMGATLPVLSQALVAGGDKGRREVGMLYAINTFGAVLGVALAGYVLLPALGNRATTMLAASGNIVAGAIALTYSRLASRRAGRLAVPPLGPSPAEEAPPGGPDAGVTGAESGIEPTPVAALTTVALAVSGAVSMLYEVGWTRALALAIGSSTYAFTSMLLAFLVGIAGGSALYSRLPPERQISPAAFALLQAGIGVATGATILLFERAPEMFLVALRWSAAPEFVQLAQFAISAGALLFSSLLIGATFPCAVAVIARNRADIGRQVGRLYGANTVGAIAGSIVAGFVLMPVLGTQAMLETGAAVNFVLAAALFAASARAKPGWRWPATAACLGAAGVALVLPHWDQRVMSSGAAIYARWYVDAARGQDLAALLRAQRIVYYRDGLSATVAVSQAGEHFFLRVNGKLDAGTAGDMPTQLMSEIGR